MGLVAFRVAASLKSQKNRALAEAQCSLDAAMIRLPTGGYRVRRGPTADTVFAVGAEQTTKLLAQRTRRAWLSDTTNAYRKAAAARKTPGFMLWP